MKPYTMEPQIAKREYEDLFILAISRALSRFTRDVLAYCRTRLACLDELLWGLGGLPSRAMESQLWFSLAVVAGALFGRLWDSSSFYNNRHRFELRIRITRPLQSANNISCGCLRFGSIFIILMFVALIVRLSAGPPGLCSKSFLSMTSSESSLIANYGILSTVLTVGICSQGTSKGLEEKGSLILLRGDFAGCGKLANLYPGSSRCQKA